MCASVSAHSAHPRRARRAAVNPEPLPHWSEVSPSRPTGDDARPLERSPAIVAILRDLVQWAADLAIKLTHDTPDDHTAIEEVRDYALAWLDGDPPTATSAEHVLFTAATLMSAIDLDLARSTPHLDDGDRHAIAAELTA